MEWIDNIIIGLLDTFETRNPYELCDCLEIEIHKVDNNNTLLQGHDSTYFRGFFENEVVMVRNDLDSKHEEFYILHEIGHAILHTNVDNSSELSNKGQLEKQANYFALRMSDISFDEFELQNYSIEQIAKYLRIPLKPLRQLTNI